MPEVQLLDFASGDLDYVTKHNNNNTSLRAFLSALSTQITGASGAAVSVGAAMRALFGPDAAVIGAKSYLATGATTILTIQAGFAWSESVGIVTELEAATTIDLAGYAAATYYLKAVGGPVLDDSSSTDALYSVVWTGAAFGAITRVAAVVDTARSIAFSDTFVNADITADAISFQHDLEELTPTVTVVDNTGLVRLDVPATVDDMDNVTLGLTGLTPITGTWRVGIRKH